MHLYNNSEKGEPLNLEIRQNIQFMNSMELPSAQSDQSLRCPHEESPWLPMHWVHSALIRPRLI